MTAETVPFEGPRACGPLEVPPTMDLLNRVFFPQEAGIGHFGPHLACEANREQMRIITVEGRVVAHAGLHVDEIATPHGELRLGGIWGVSCHADFRRHGFGAACVRDAMHRMQELGCDLGWLGTGITDWYRKFGWEVAGRGYTFEYDRGNVGLLPELEGWEVAEGLWADPAEMVALHEQERLGCRRDPQVFAALVRGRQLGCYTAARGGKLGAYALVQGHSVIEHAGEAETVAGLLREVFRRRDTAQAPTSTTNRPGWLEVETPVTGPTAELLQDLRIPHHYRPRGMMWVASPQITVEKLGLAEEVRLTEHEAGVTLRRGGEEVRLSERELVKLMLGPERITEFAEDLFPLEFYHWALDMV